MGHDNHDNQYVGTTTNDGGRLETDVLAELIDEKHKLLEQLRDLSRRQSELVERGDMTKLLNVLSAKQKLLHELGCIERRLDPFRDQAPESRRWRSPADRRRVQQTAERCDAMLDEIMSVEKQSETALIRRRDEAEQRLQGVHTASQARNAYTRPAGPNSSQLDLTSDT
jgi:flagellar biosynthesis/type III secretory pathway chaperone